MRPDEYGVMFAAEEAHWWYRSLRAWLRMRLGRRVPRGARVLDAGCGTGANLALLAAMGYRAVGLDLWPAALRLAARRPGAARRMCRGSVTRLPFATGGFDAVVAMDVLYLLDEADEAAALAEFRRVLRPGGLLILHLPAHEWLRGDRPVGNLEG